MSIIVCRLGSVFKQPPQVDDCSDTQRITCRYV